MNIKLDKPQAVMLEVEEPQTLQVILNEYEGEMRQLVVNKFGDKYTIHIQTDEYAELNIVVDKGELARIH